MPDERNPLQAQAGEVESAAARLVQALEAATRDVAESAQFAVERINVPRYSGTRAGAAEINAETAALERRNAAEAESLALDEARLRLLQEQNMVMAAAASRGIVIGAAPYRAGGGRANVAAEAEAQSAAAQAEAQSLARRTAITAGVPTAYSTRGADDTAARRVAEAEAQVNAELKAEQANVVRLIELYGERATAAQATVRAELEANAAEIEGAAATRRRVTNWAMGSQAVPFPTTSAHPSVVRATLEDLERGGFGPGTGAPRPPGLFPITHVTPGPSAETEFSAYANSLGSQRNVANAANDIQRLGRIQNEASQAMRRHGALTTEFLSALGRGEVTVQEFGYQIGATAGKFAGWTAAAAGVFGVIGLFKQVADGAKDAQNEAANLQRFIPHLDRNQAQQGFVGVSREVNVPIKDVGEAQAQFARIFHNQHDSLEAARASLIATKLDNVSTADSYRYFTAVVQEWRLNASDLPRILDQITGAQDRMGAKVAEVLPAFARASSAVKNTGGDMNQLIALIATAQVATGRTGPEIGTAFARAAANFYQTPKSEGIERGFGLDPTLGFTQFLEQAMQRARDLSGAQRQQLGRAIFGPLRGGTIGAPLLGQSDRLERATAATSPGDTQGLAVDQLAKKLQGVHEILHSITNTIQQIGVELGRSGSASGLGVLLEGFRMMLTSVERLLELFNMLPGSIRPWVALALEGAAAMAFTRETRIGGAIASATRLDRLPGFGRSAAATERDEFVSGARASSQMAANMRESTINQALVTKAREEAALQVAAQNRALAEEVGADGQYVRNQTERDALLQESNMLEQKAAQLKAESLALERTAAAYDEQRLASLETAAAVQRRTLTVTEAQSVTAGETAAAGAAGTAAQTEALGARSAGIMGGMFRTGFLGALGELGMAAIGLEFGKQVVDDLARRLHLPGSAPHAVTHGGVGTGPQPGPSMYGHTGALSNFEDLWSGTKRLVSTGFGLWGDDGGEPGSGQLFGAITNAPIFRTRATRRPRVLSLYEQLQALSEQDLIKQAESDATRVANYASTTGRGAVGTDSLNKLQTEYHVALDRAKANPTSGNLNTLAKLQDDINKAIIQPTTQALSDALALTSDPQRRAAAYAGALSHLANAPGRAGQVARQQVRQQQFQENQQYYDAYTSYLQSTTTDPLQQARVQQQRDESQLPRMQEGYHRGVVSYTDFWNFMAKINQDRQKTEQAILDDFTQQQQLADAQFALAVGGDQGAVLGHTVSDAQTLIAKVQSLGTSAPKGAMTQALTSLAQAQLALLQYNLQQAQEVYDATFQASHVADQGDPVRAARDQLIQDMHDLMFARGPGARAQQQAKVTQDRYNIQQQIIQEDINRAGFEHQVGQLSDSAYVTQLQQILRMKQISTQTRRQLLEQIYQLNQSAGQNLELDVGSIKLPTLYDVRRAAAAGAASRGASFGGGNVIVHHSPVMQFEINVAKPGDASTVFKTIEDATNTSLRGSLRAAGAL